VKKIYLAGPISGLTYDGAQDWRNKFSAAIDDRIECFSPLRGKDYLTMRGKLEGSYDEFPLSTDQGITTRDRYDCMGADLVVFNMLGATERVSIGTMIELGWADATRRPAILIMEKEGNIHEHPMVRQTTQFRVDNINDAVRIAEIILLGKAKPVKWIDTTPGADFKVYYDAEPMKLSDIESWSGLPK
jgi:nucleoside 2-deoxyribosyltransferase